MKKLLIDHERLSSANIDYGDLVYVMDKLNEMIDRINTLELINKD
jgi:hypothetical protein